MNKRLLYHLKFYKLVLLLIAAILLYSCGTPRPFYNSGSKNKADSLQNRPISYQLFLIGDTGRPVLNGPDPVLETLHTQLMQAGDSSSIVFLGDNIYDDGMNPDTTLQARKEDEAQISKTLSSLQNYSGQSYFVAGNHDWLNGKRGLLAQENFIENYAKADAKLVPDNGCPGPQSFNLAENWFLITLDSEWWINRSFGENVQTEDCPAKTRAQVINEIARLLDENDDKQIVLAFHHPLKSSGSHGGYYSFRDHIFPLSNLNDKLYVPLPLIGSIYPLYRKLGQSGQDIGHDRYQEFKREILEATEDKENVFFASGHEHSLALYEEEKANEDKEGEDYFILSGSGSKQSYARTGYGAEFVYSHKGFAKLVSYENGKVDVEYWVPDDENKQGKLVFVKELIEPEPAVDPMEKLAERMAKAEGPQNTQTTVAAGPEYKAGPAHRFIWGDHYRDAWTAKIDVPVLDFKKEKGGLKVIGRTGGEQSVTIIVQDSAEQKYVMRSVQKDPRESLPEILQPTFVSEIAQDQTSASHPYSSVITPPMATAAGLYNTSPELFYISEKSGLDLDVGEKEGTLVALQDFVSKEWFSRKYSKETKSVLSTDELWEKMRVGDTGTINQKQLVRSRIFDMFIGDWDRHEGQWFWAETVGDSGSVYEPVPIDRDNAYFMSDGAIPWLAKRKWALRKFQLFDNGIRDIAGINFNAQFFDRWFINELSRNDWINLGKEMQQALTDSVLENAVNRWPKPIVELNGETFIEKLKARRAKLPQFARRYYDVLSKDVNVFGSDEAEIFEVERRVGGQTRVWMYAAETDSTPQRLKFKRVFKNDETGEIRLYGFGEADRFALRGDVDEGITVRIIGGPGDDTVDDQSDVRGWIGKTLVYDTKDGSSISSLGEVRDYTSTDPGVNRYEKRSFKYNLLMPLVDGGYNRNDGLFLGGGALIVKQGFRKEPFKSKHRFTGKVATLTSAFSFSQSSIFTDAVGVFDVELNTEVLAPNYSSNFFGLGNETEKVSESREFYGYRINNVDLEAQLSNELADLLTVRAGAGYEYFKPSATENRFVTSPESGLIDSDFAPYHYGTLHAGFTVNTVDSEIYPRYGVDFNVLADLKVGLNGSSSTFGRINTWTKIFYTLEEITTTVASRIGFASNIGDYQFFQANTLGGRTFSGGSGNLRGFLRNRFSGRTILYHNTDIRMKLLNVKSYLLPTSVGVWGFVDEGKVWTENENSNLWHIGYGGGIWVSPLDRIVLSAGLAFSEEERLFTLGLGFTF